MMTPEDLVDEMLETTTDALPDRWKEARNAMQNGRTEAYSGYSLQDWLEEIYFDYRLKQDLTREDSHIGRDCRQNATV